MGQMIYLKNVVTLALDAEKCVRCETRLLVCPQAVLSRSKKGRIRELLLVSGGGAA